MKQDEFDRALMDEMSQLPPSPDALQDYTPWQNAMVKLLVGMKKLAPKDPAGDPEKPQKTNKSKTNGADAA